MKKWSYIYHLLGVASCMVALGAPSHYWTTTILKPDHFFYMAGFLELSAIRVLLEDQIKRIK